MENETNNNNKSLQELLDKYPNTQIGKIMGDKYRVMETKKGINMILRLGFKTSQNNEPPLILIPRDGRNNEASVIEFVNNDIIYERIDTQEIFQFLELAKGALELILSYNNIREGENRELTLAEKKQLTNIDCYECLDKPTLSSAQAMLTTIDRELGDEQEY